MEALARLLVRRPVAWAVVALTIALLAIAAYYAARVSQDDDLVAFLPEESAEVAQFRAITREFGGLDVAVVGIETKDVFEPAFLTRLAAGTTRLEGVRGVEGVLSLSNVDEFLAGAQEGAVRITDLVDEIPRGSQEIAALREKVMSRDHVAGTLVSADDKAVVLYCFIARGSEARAVADAIEEVATDAFPDDRLVWAGAPFVRAWAHDTAWDDLARLVPRVVVVTALLLFLSLRSAFTSGLALFVGAAGVVIARGVMGALDIDDELVLTSMWVVLFAIGCASGTPVLFRYQALARAGASTDDAVVGSLRDAGPAVLATGAATAVALLSLIAMDAPPMGTFGASAALAVGVATVLAVTFVPVVVVLARPRPPVDTWGPVQRWLGEAMAWVRRHRGQVGGSLLGVCALAGAAALSVDGRIDDAAYFDVASRPAQATAFLDSHFKGARFLRLRVDADLGDPDVLREVQRTADRIDAVDGVTDVRAAPTIVSLVNEAMTGVRRIPDTREQVAAVYGLLAGDPAFDGLITTEHDAGLLVVRLSARDVDDVEEAIAAIEEVLDESVTRYEVGSGDQAKEWRIEVVAERIAAMQRRQGKGGKDGKLRERLSGPVPGADPAVVEKALVRFLVSDEGGAPLDLAVAKEVAHAVAAIGPDADEAALREAMITALGPDTSPDDLAAAIAGPLADAWRRASDDAFGQDLVDHGLFDLAADDDAIPSSLRGALLDLEGDHGLVPSTRVDAHTIAWTISGQPVLYQAVSRSVSKGQIASLAVSLGLVWLILALRFRSPWGGLLASTPMLVALAVAYGVMGFMNVRLDLGTSMVAALVIGTGVAGALHLLSAWRAPEGGDLAGAARAAAEDSGGAIATNALVVAAGFVVLASGQALPLENVGRLVALAVITATVATFVAVPLLARRTRYGR